MEGGISCDHACKGVVQVGWMITYEFQPFYPSLPSASIIPAACPSIRGVVVYVVRYVSLPGIHWIALLFCDLITVPLPPMVLSVVLSATSHLAVVTLVYITLLSSQHLPPPFEHSCGSCYGRFPNICTFSSFIFSNPKPRLGT